MKQIVKDVAKLIEEKAANGFYNSFGGHENYYCFNFLAEEEESILSISISHLIKENSFKITFERQLSNNKKEKYLNQQFYIKIDEEEFNYLVPRCDLKIEELTNKEKDVISKQFGLDFNS